MKRIVIGLPVYKPHDPELYARSMHSSDPLPAGLAHPAFEESFYKTVKDLRNEFRFSLATVTGDGQLDRARAILLGDYLWIREQTTVDFYWMLDSDVSWDPLDVFRMVQRKVDCIGAAYSIKRDADAALGRWAGRTLEGETPDATGLLRVLYLAGGFTLVSDSAMQKLIHKYAHLRFINNPPSLRPSYGLWRSEFGEAPKEWGVEGAKEYLGEDYTFSWRLEQAGIPRYLDLNVKLGHWAGDECWRLPEEKAA